MIDVRTMRYDMKLDLLPFERMNQKKKTIELRLNDEKRKEIKVGDLVFFHLLQDEYKVIKTKVIQVHHFPDFDTLYQSLPLEKCGYSKEEVPLAKSEDMLEYYSLQEQQKNGVLGIEVEKIDNDYLADCHMHLEYGPLSKDYVLEFVKEALHKGLDEIDILDHTHRFKEFKPCYEHLRIYPQQDKWLQQTTKFCNTLDEYLKLINEIKQMDLPIRIRFGLEVCYTRDTEDMLRQILDKHPFDFLTGAVHSFNHILYDMSFSKQLLWDRYPADQIYQDYYEALFDCVRSSLFDRLAHPDTIKLFQIYPAYDLKDTYRQLCLLLNEKKMYAENNTGCHYRYNHPDIGLSDELLQMFIDHQVRVICASDAHHPKDVGSYIREALKRMKGESYGKQML